MKKENTSCPFAPLLIIILVSILSIVIAIADYINPELIPVKDVTFMTLLASGLLCLTAAIMTLVFSRKQAYVEETIEEETEKEPVVPVTPPPPPQVDSKEPRGNDQAILLLSLLQEKGRFVDFVMGDVTMYNDEQIGSAARIVHQGCRELIIDCFHPEAISSIEENGTISLESDFNTREYKIIGNVIGEPPYSGMLLHKGWKAAAVKLPRLTLPQSETDSPVIQPAEIELNA